MTIVLPKDAEGREIPLDTKVLYDEEGNPQNVARFTYSPRNMVLDKRWEVVFIGAFDRCTSEMFLNPPEPPDSLERLADELEKVGDLSDRNRYYAAGSMFREWSDRIRKLAKKTGGDAHGNRSAD